MSRMSDLNAVAQEAGIDTSAPDALAQVVEADREASRFENRAAYAREWRSRPGRAERARAFAMAQGRARVRLVALYPTTYAALYAEEKAALGLEDVTP